MTLMTKLKQIISKVFGRKKPTLSDEYIWPEEDTRTVAEVSAYRQKGESLDEYNRRIPVGKQPALPPQKYDYLGRPRD